MRGREAVNEWQTDMTIHSMKNQSFASVNEEQWKKGAEQTLRGKAIDTLEKITYEQIRLKPLYMQADINSDMNVDQSMYPSFMDFRRGIDAASYKTNQWKIAQQINATNINDLKVKLDQAFHNGQTAITFQLTDKILHQLDSLENILADIFTIYPFGLHVHEIEHQLIEKLVQMAHNEKISNQLVTGFIAFDPLAQLVSKGGLKESLEATYDEWSEFITSAYSELPQLKTIGVDTSHYHNSGANAVQELAIALAAGVYHVEQLSNRGLSLETIFSNMIFRFSIGANFFMEIAKLRAARILWGKIAEAYGVSEEYRKMHISAQTSTFTKTIYDPHVNILRATNEAFAAVIGGVQFLQVTCFDETYRNATESAERIARNTQLILQEEALLKHVADPAGGSWYLESLTKQLAEKAWKQFLSIDERGGLVQSLKTGQLQKEILKIKKQRLDDVLTRRQSIIGTNKYANLAEQVLIQKSEITEKNGEALQEKITRLQAGRLAEPFEKLRQKAEQRAVTIEVICLGELKNYKSRADFLTGFFAAGGIQTVIHESNETLENLQSIIRKSNRTHFVLCGSDEAYEEFPKDDLKMILENDRRLTFFVAGLPQDEAKQQWKRVGVQQFIHLKSNCYELLNQILTEMEGNE